MCCVQEHLLIPLILLSTFTLIVVSSIVVFLNTVCGWRLSNLYLLSESHLWTPDSHVHQATWLSYLDANKNLKINMTKLENVSSKASPKSLPPTLFSISINGHSFQLLSITGILIDSSHFSHTLYCVFLLILLCLFSKYSQHWALLKNCIPSILVESTIISLEFFK